MAKRSNRGRRSRAAEERAEAREISLAEEYRYVLEDLRRLAIVAVVLVGGLVVLSLLI